jgi:hypothetical protein
LKIRKKEVHIIGDYEDENPLKLCPNCLEHGSMGVLGPRLLLPNETKTSDWDQFLSCESCYTVVPIYEAKIRSQIEDFSELTENPFKEGSNILGLGNKQGAETDIQKERRKQLEEADKASDEIEIKQALRKGLIVDIIQDGLDDY